MSKVILTNVRFFTGGADLTGSSAKVEITAEVEDKDRTNYASGGWKEIIGGLASAEIAGEGQWEAGDPGKVDDQAWASLGGLGAWSVGPTGAAAGDLAYFTRMLRGSYTLGGAVGDVAPWTSNGKSAWPLIRGVFAHPPGIARTADGSGAAVQLAAVPAGKRLYAALHVLSVAGTSSPSVTVSVESDTSSGFASPEVQLQFAPVTQPGSQIVRTTGAAIADTYYRVAWDVSGTAPSFLFVSTIGIW